VFDGTIQAQTDAGPSTQKDIFSMDRSKYFFADAGTPVNAHLIHR
jgi:hypothetical protein